MSWGEVLAGVWDRKEDGQKLWWTASGQRRKAATGSLEAGTIHNQGCMHELAWSVNDKVLFRLTIRMVYYNL